MAPDGDPIEPERRRALRSVALATSAAIVGAVAGRASAEDLGSGDAGSGGRPESEQGTPAQPGATSPWRYVAPGESIQDAIDDGAGAIQLGDGRYEVARPIEVTPGLRLRGIGPRSVLLAAPSGGAPMPAVISVGGGAQVDGVSVGALFIACGGRAETGIDVHIVGSDQNTFGEPDSVCRLDDLRIWSPTEHGIWYRGADAQAIVTSRVRVRQAGRYGYRIESPDNVWLACEATTSPDPLAGDRPAGFLVASANNHFDHCKAWYCRGYGFHVAAVRNTFTGCEAQDCADHGFFVEWGRNSLTGCFADTCSAAVTGGTTNGADGFFVRPETPDVVLTGCLAFDRTDRPQQRFGFNVPAAMVADGRFGANAAWDNATGGVNQR